VRVAAIGDLHCRVGSDGMVRRLLDGVQDEADVLLLAGDLTNLGLAQEMELLLDELAIYRMPMLAVMGNHDHESDQVDVLAKLMRDAGVVVLDGDVHEVDGVEFVGMKGAWGGFGVHRLHPFGERLLKEYIMTSVHEAERLEDALQRLHGERRVAMLHYAPIAGTVQGECPEIYPFLGFSLFADAIDRYGVDVIVHGHAHHGSPEGATPGGIPVHNVSRYVLSRTLRQAYRVFEV
jgi:Icc-related predicted phosphoesterase